MIRRLAPVAAFLAAACAAGSPPGRPEPSAPAARPTSPAPAKPAPTSTFEVARFGTGDLRFRVERRDSLLLEYPNGIQSQTIDRTAWVRLLIAGGTQVTVALDSMRSPSIPADSLRPLDGTVWTGTLEQGRRLGALSSVRRAPLAEQLALPMIQDLLPVLPETGARSGATWRDSTTTPQRLAGAELRVTTVTEFRAAEAAGARELAITGDTRVSARDTSATFGQPIEITASGVRQRTWRLAAGGQLVGAEGTDSVAMTLDVPSVGQTVPATQRTRFTATRVGTTR